MKHLNFKKIISALEIHALVVSVSIKLHSSKINGCFPASVLRSPAFLPSCRLWVGYQYVITGRNHSLEGRWEVAFKGKPFWFFKRVVEFEIGVYHPD